MDTNSDGLVLRRSKHLATTKKHIQVYRVMVTNINTYTSLSSQVRQAAKIKYLTAAQKMANRYNRKKCVKSFGVGDKVSVRMPRIDCTCSDLFRLPCPIVEVLGGVQGVYCLQYAILNFYTME